MKAQIISLLLLISVQLCSGQKVLFYNLENFFDAKRDHSRDYNAFTPEGKNKWTERKFREKVNLSAKSILAAGSGKADYIGLAEIENKNVLETLIKHPLLKEQSFDFIHIESRDVRGIDVAFLFRKSQFDLLSFQNIQVPLKKRPTRDILFVYGIDVLSSDTLGFYVNHWPSRYGGKRKSEPSRILAAQTLKNHMDSVMNLHPNCYLIAMGDMNDEPKDSSLKILSIDSKFTNIMTNANLETGTIKYRGNWQIFDQFIVSKNLLQERRTSVEIFNEAWLMEEDKKYGGLKPKRSFRGPIFHGGVSDHLPILMQIKGK